MSLELNKRRELNRELTWDEGDDNWEAIEEAINAQQPNPNAVTIENEYSAISGVFGQDLLPSQSQQTTGAIQFVEDASDDPNANTQNGSPYAYYEKLETSTGQLSDYRLLSSSEIAEIQGAAQKVGDQNGNEFSTALKVVYGNGFTVIPLAGGGYRVNYDPIGKMEPLGNVNAFELDWKDGDSHYFTMTESFTMTETNLLGSVLTKARCLIVAPGNDLTLPARYKKIGEPDNTKTRLYVIKHVSDTLALCQITNFD